MALNLVLTTLAIGSAVIYLFVKWSNSRTLNAMAIRNVPYVKLNSVIWSVFKKERTELTIYDIIKRQGLKVFGFPMFNTNTILCSDPDIAGTVLSKEFTNFTNRRRFDIDDPIFGAFLSNAQDDQWKRLRAIVTPTFSSGSLRRMKPRIDETVRNLIGNFESAMKASSDVDVKKLYGAFTMDTIIQVAFGTKVDSINDPNNPVIKHAQKVFSADMSVKQFGTILVIFLFPKLAKLLGLQIQKEAVSFFQGFSQQIIKHKKEELRNNAASHGKASSFLELVLEAEAEFEQQQQGVLNGNGHSDASSVKKAVKYMSTDEMVATCILFFLAGYDTTATTITLASYLMALHPEIQQKLYLEIESVLEKLSKEEGNVGKDPIELVSTENLHRFEYLNGVINETLRIYAPATATERQASKDIVLQNEDGSIRINLKKGDVMQFPIYSMHRDPEQWPEPEEFRPERFIGEPTHHKYSYLPFGSGPRNCIARSLALLEAKLALLHTIRVFKFSRGDKTKVPFEMYYQNNFIAPRDIVLKVEKRVSA